MMSRDLAEVATVKTEEPEQVVAPLGAQATTLNLTEHE